MANMRSKRLYLHSIITLAIGLLPSCNAFNIHSGSIRHAISTKARHRKHKLFAASNAIDGVGMPSNPGWPSGRLNRLTEWVDSAQPNRPIICEYNPKGLWLWRKWKGTVLQAVWRSVLLAIFMGFAIDFYARGCSLSNYKLSWDMASVPNASDQFIKRLSAIGKVWEYQLQISTFILTFFLSHAFSYWQKVYNTTRMIQGRINGEYLLGL